MLFNDLFRNLGISNSSKQRRRNRSTAQSHGSEPLEARQLLTTFAENLLDPSLASSFGKNDAFPQHIAMFTAPKNTETLKTATGATKVVAAQFLKNAYQFTFATPKSLKDADTLFGKIVGFDGFTPVFAQQREKRLVPNDPLYVDQWHLNNTGQGGGTAGLDVNVDGVWDNYRGAGVVIGVVDDGVQLTHEDLAANARPGLSFDWNGNDNDPSPNVTGDFHGTAVAGVAAGVGNNNLGISGAAPESGIAGLRLIAAPSTDLQEAQALTWQNNQIHIYNNSWGPADNGRISGIGPQAAAALAQGIATGRNGLGSIFAWAGGNGGERQDNVNYDAYANSRHTIAIGALDENGIRASYSEPGAPLIVTAYTQGNGIATTTTDLMGDDGYNAAATNDGDSLANAGYTSTFNGTSSATPLAAGVMALMLQANPTLTSRDVQDILVHTARRTDLNNPGWSQNGAGLWVNHEYGFGAIDAQAAVTAALNFVHLAPEVTASTGVRPVSTPIPDGSGVVRSTVNASQNISLEYVEIYFSATHTNRGQLNVTLISPSGTRSVLAATRTVDNNPDTDPGYSRWRFTTARNWDESSQGTWTIEVSDPVGGDSGTFDSYELQFYGTNADIPVPAAPVISTPSGTIATPSPTYGWTAPAFAATYELEVSKASGGVILSRSGLTQTSFRQPTQLTEGNYSVRVRAVNSELEVGPWSTPRSFTVNVPTPARPNIVSPRGTIGNSYPVFEWTASQNAASYDLRVVNALTNQRIIYRTNYVGLTYSHFSELKDGTYIMTVLARNSVGEMSAPSDAVVFTIDSPVPATPKLTAPAKTTTSTNPRFVWTAVSGVARYELAVNNLSTGKKDYIRETNLPRTSTFFDPKYFTQGNYVAYIRAINGNGEASPWSPKYSFTVDVLPPDAPVVTGPRGANESSTVTTTNPTFRWTSVARAVKYDLWVNNLTTKKSQVIRQKNLTTTSYTPVGNMDQGKYRVYVRGINIANEVGEWSKLLDFTIDEPTPARPVIVAPVPSALGFVDNANPTFVWTANPAAPFYEFQLQNVSLNKQAISVKGLTKPRYTVPTSLRLGEYSYSARVRSVNVSGDVSSWSEAYTIRIDVPAPTTPRLIGPGNSSKDTTPTFTWFHGGSATRYEILVRDLVRNEQISLQVKTFQLSPDGSTATYTLPNSRALAPSTYRFWVRAFNSTDQASGWSTSKTFVILASVDSGLQDNSESADAGLLLLTNAVTDSREVDSDPNIRRVTYVTTDTESDAAVIPVKSSGVYETTAYQPSVSIDETEDLALIDAIMNRLADPTGDLDISRHQS